MPVYIVSLPLFLFPCAAHTQCINLYIPIEHHFQVQERRQLLTLGAKPERTAELGSLLCFTSVFSLLFLLDSSSVFVYFLFFFFLFFTSSFFCIFTDGFSCIMSTDDSIRQPGPLMCFALNIILKALKEDLLVRARSQWAAYGYATRGSGSIPPSWDSNRWRQRTAQAPKCSTLETSLCIMLAYLTKNAGIATNKNCNCCRALKFTEAKLMKINNGSKCVQYANIIFLARKLKSQLADSTCLLPPSQMKGLM